MKLFYTALLLTLMGSPPALAQKASRAAPKASRILKSNPQQKKNQLDRLRRMNPDERRRWLDSLPPARRQAIEPRLDRLAEMEPQERRKLIQQLDRFQQMPPKRREEMRRLYGRFNQLPEDRRPLLREEVQNLQNMTPEARRARANSDEFRNKYTAKEQQLMTEMAELMAEQAPPDPE
jgi:hypothetical protein